MTEEYALWVGLTVLLMGAGTWGALAAWARAIRREEAEALRIVRGREADARARAEAERRGAAALAVSERRHRALTEAGAIVVWRATPDGRIAAVEGWLAFTGQDPADVIGSVEAWLAVVVPEDRARAALAWKRAVTSGRTFEIEFRVTVASGVARWCRARAVLVPAEDGAGGEWIGVIEDIDTRRRAEEARLLLAREVNHRAKNMLAVVQAVVRLTRVSEPEAFVAAVSARIAALGRAHDLLAQRDWSDVGLHDLARGELAPYLQADAGEGAARPRVRVGGPTVRLSASTVQPLAIALHELAVNAAKYGALSPGSGGEVELEWEELPGSGGLRLVWTERGGPPLPAAPASRGFGTRVIDTTVADQLGGTVARQWLPEGLRCEITLPFSRLGRLPDEERPPARVG